MKKLGFLIASGLILAGCSTAPEVETITPVKFDTKKSHALNLANQTFLTKPHKWGFETVESPLKDFTKDEIDEINTELTLASGGTASMVVGAMSILSGNLTGAISVAGGASANIANSDHAASQVRWIVALDSKDFDNSLEATKHYLKLVDEEILTLMHEKGNHLVPFVYRKPKKAKITRVDIPGINAFGLNSNLIYFISDTNYANLTKGELISGQTNLIKADLQYVSGYTSVSAQLPSFKHFIDGRVKGYKGWDGYEKFLIDLTSRLPEGYMVYLPSFPETVVTTVKNVEEWDECITCKDHDFYKRYKVLPSIYTQGKKYDFIKPQI